MSYLHVHMLLDTTGNLLSPLCLVMNYTYFKLSAEKKMEDGSSKEFTKIGNERIKSSETRNIKSCISLT